MNANATHPLSKLTYYAEAALVASIDAATARLEAVGTSQLDAALERLRSAAHAASARLAEEGLTVAPIAGDLLGVSLGMESAMGREDAVAQVEPAVGYAYEEPAVLQHLPPPEVLARLPSLFAGQQPPAPEPAPRRTGFPIVDDFLDIARDAEAEVSRVLNTQPVAGVEISTPATPTQIQGANGFAYYKAANVAGMPATPTQIQGANGRTDATAEPQTPSEKYPAAPASSPDGPSLFDAAGNAADPTEALAKPFAVPFAPGVPVARTGANGDSLAGQAGGSPQRKREGG